MAHKTTFGDPQLDECYRRVERSVKSALPRKECGKSTDNGHASPMQNWQNISSINADTLDSSYTTPYASQTNSEVIAASNNLRNVLLRKKCYAYQRMISTSSIKQDNHIDRLKMPPPMVDTAYCTKRGKRVLMSSNCNNSTLIQHSNPMSSMVNKFPQNNFATYTSINIDDNEKYMRPSATTITSNNEPQKVDRIFSSWRVMLNDQNQLLIKGTIECGKVARSKPIIRRFTATCVESMYKYKYYLQGNIVDERNELPDYIRGKFYNGFPDDWENVHQIWKAFINQGCRVTFRWPTPVTDSDDDLNSEITDLIYMKSNESNTTMKSYKPAESVEQLIISDTASNKAPEKKKKYNCIHSFQCHENNHSYVRSPSDTRKDTTFTTKTQNVTIDDNFNKQNVKENENVNLSCSSKKKNKLKDIIQEDKLNIIINNLVDKNCSSEYIDKIIVMLDCLDYVTSYRTESEYNSDSMVRTSHEMSKAGTIPVKRILVDNEDKQININKFENTMGSKSHIHSSDMGYSSTKNYSYNPAQISNTRSHIEAKHNDHENSGESESETYAGIPKISIEKILRKKASDNIYKRKIKKKIIHSDTRKYITRSKHSANAPEFANHAMIPITNAKKNLLSDESCVSITEDEVEALNRTYYNTTNRKYYDTNFVQSQGINLSNHQELQGNNFDIHRKARTDKPIMQIQNEQSCHTLYTSEARKDRLNVCTTKQKIPENLHSQFSDIDYTMNSNTDTEKDNAENIVEKNITIASHPNPNRNVISNENKDNLPEKLCILRDLRKNVINQSNENVIEKSKPNIISSVPVNVNLRITTSNLKLGQSYDSGVTTIENDKEISDYTNIRPFKEARKKHPPSKASVSTKSAIVNDSYSKVMANSKNEEHLISNFAHSNKTKLEDVTSVDSTKSTMDPIKQSKNNELGVKDNPKVLTAWVPKVVHNSKSKSGLGLVFEGKLLNEAGHVVHRKFTTDIVLRRVSTTLIETVNHEFYQLSGCLSNNKHVIPRELVKQCYNGCPSKIERFCISWKTLQNEVFQLLDKASETEKKLNNTSVDLLNIPVSSKGRRILPPLCYWKGERVTLKNDIPVYSAGSSQESTLTFLNDNTKDTLETKDKERQKIDCKSPSPKKIGNKRQSLIKSNETYKTNKNQISSSNMLSKTEDMNNARKSINSTRYRKSALIGEQKITEQLTVYSSDSSDDAQRVSPQKHNSHVNADVKYGMKFRKRQKVDASGRASYAKTEKSKYDTACYSSTKKCERNIVCTYYQGVSLPDLLSEDQLSSI